MDQINLSRSMLRMKNKTGEVGDLSAVVLNRVPEDERMQQKSGCNSHPSWSMLRINNSSLEIGGEGEKTGANKRLKCHCPRQRQLKKFKNQMPLSKTGTIESNSNPQFVIAAFELLKKKTL